MKVGRSSASAVYYPTLLGAGRGPASGVSISQRPVMTGRGPARAATVLQKLVKAGKV